MVRTWLVVTVLNLVAILNYVSGKAFYQRDLMAEALADDSVNIKTVQETLTLGLWIWKLTILCRCAISLIYLKYPKVIYATYFVSTLSFVILGMLQF
jgi:hypothetical protein